MGHDIYGLKAQRYEQVAYLRRNAFAGYTNLYRWLRIEKHGAGDVSGDGTTHVFTIEDIKGAIEQAQKEEAEADELEFLQNCLRAAKADEFGKVMVQVA